MRAGGDYTSILKVVPSSTHITCKVIAAWFTVGFEREITLGNALYALYPPPGILAIAVVDGAVCGG